MGPGERRALEAQFPPIPATVKSVYVYFPHAAPIANVPVVAAGLTNTARGELLQRLLHGRRAILWPTAEQAHHPRAHRRGQVGRSVPAARPLPPDGWR